MSSLRERLKARRQQVSKLIASTQKAEQDYHSKNGAASDPTSISAPEQPPSPKRTKVEVPPDSPIKSAPQTPQTSAAPSMLPPEDCVEALLAAPSARERENRKVATEIQDLLNKPTAKELALIEKFKSDGTQMREFCPHGTKDECYKVSSDGRVCGRLHFRKIIQKHTDMSLGDCSFLNTCFHMDTCKYIHYEVDYGKKGKSKSENERRASADKSTAEPTAIMALSAPTVLYPAQWIQCDMRFFDMSVLGKFSVIMADPPWDIHMELPYGTMSDDEMRRLNVLTVQDEGLIFLWVTGRAMELGRECLRLWGYRQVDEIIWVKTNQLQRIIRTGRTGHWLNHGKEHCLVGVKGSCSKYYAGIDCDVIVAEVRATSHKPDEVYGLIERLSPGTRKIELFGRQHNVQPNWITLGNQLDGVRLLDPDVVYRFKDRYPDGNCMPTPQDVLLYKQQKNQRR